MRVLRRQLPVSSPLSAPALLAAAAAALRPRPEDAARLLHSLVDRHGAADGVLCGSGTQALQLAVAAALAASGDPAAPVALPAFTCYDVAAAAVGAGARVALYDVDPRTLAPDGPSLERVLAAGAGAVVVAWAYGHPPPWDEVLAAADRYGARVVEDAAQGHGGAWRGRPAGSFGALSVLSFGRGKGWTGGRGGALLVRAPALPLPSPPGSGVGAEMENVATAVAAWALGRPSLYALPASLPGLGLGETVYREPREPRAILRSSAALLLRTRDAADGEAAARRRVARTLLDALADADAVAAIDAVDGAEPGCLRLPLRISGGRARLPAGAARLGIAPAYPRPLSALPALRDRLAGPERRFPGAESLAASLVTLPTHSAVTPADAREIVRLLRGIASSPRSISDQRPTPVRAG